MTCIGVESLLRESVASRGDSLLNGAVIVFETDLQRLKIESKEETQGCWAVQLQCFTGHTMHFGIVWHMQTACTLLW